MTLDNLKSEEGQDDYYDKTQKPFKTMKFWVIRYEFLKFLPWQGSVREFDLAMECSHEGLNGVISYINKKKEKLYSTCSLKAGFQVRKISKSIKIQTILFDV